MKLEELIVDLNESLKERDELVSKLSGGPLVGGPLAIEDHICVLESDIANIYWFMNQIMMHIREQGESCRCKRKESNESK